MTEQNTKPEAENTETEAVTEVQDSSEQSDNGSQNGQEKKKGGDLQIALKQEREERKRIASELKSEREKREKFEKRFSQIFNDNEEPENKDVRFDDDPANYLRQKTEKVEKDSEEIKNFFNQQRAMQNLTNFAQSQIASYKKEAPDYNDAYEFVRKERMEEYMDMYDMSEEEAIAAVNQEELNFTIECAQNKRNPAKALYKYAQRRGYKKSEDAEQTIDRIQKGQDGAKSLSQVGGKSNSSLTLESLLAMSEEQFSEFKKKNPEKFRKLMGASA